MFGGVNIEKCGAIPPGFAAIRRSGKVCEHGKLKDMLAAYKSGDWLLVSYALWDELRATIKPPRDPSEATRP